ncbi:carbon monoxide dehydrogenase [Alicyclobacillaceae bacterium I2511]|jgi:carbon monoxide dehydrogenase subunit G|nr:carbon monoxide dehydrogenase [Alicyclobacillaceae bacterium I2511]
MQLSGHKIFPISRAQTFAMLTNPEVIIRCMPGLKSLKTTGKNQYDAELEIGVAGLKGTYQGNLQLTDIIPEQAYRLSVQGKGPMGFMESDVQVRLTDHEKGTQVHYQGVAKVGGTVAGVGQRVLSGVATLLINQFFNTVAKEAQQGQA